MDFVHLMTERFDIRSQILSHLSDTRDLWSLCNSTKKFGLEMMAERYNVNSRLKKFVRDPRQFRSLQGQTNVFFNGPAALHLAQSSENVPGNERPDACEKLDIFGPANAQQEWREYLVSEGWALGHEKPDKSKTEYLLHFTRGTQEIFGRFNKTHIETFLQQLSLTIEAIMVTWDRIFVLFARETLVDRMAHLLEKVSMMTGLAMHFYNWPATRLCCQMPPNPLNHDQWTPESQRSVDDEDSLVISLDTTGLDPPPRAMNFGICEFAVMKSPWGAQIEAATLSHPLLRHTYTTYRLRCRGQYLFGDLARTKDTVLDFALPWQALATPNEARPPAVLPDVDDTLRPLLESWTRNFTDSGWQVPDSWVPPSGWLFLDDRLPEFVWKLQMSRHA